MFFRQVASSLESMEVMALGERAIMQYVCIVLELAPYRSKRYLMPGGLSRGLPCLCWLRCLESMQDESWGIDIR